MSSPLKQNTTTIQNLLNTINSLPEAGGVDLPELPNPAINDDVFLGKEYIDEDGTKQVGAFTIASELAEQHDIIGQITNALNGKLINNTNFKGISAASCGSFVLDADTTSGAYYITHDLGCIPSFFCVYAELGHNVSEFAGKYLVLYVHLHYPHQVGDSSNIGVAFSYFGNDDGSKATNMTTAFSVTECTSNKLYVYLNTRKLKAGIKYNWICCVTDTM